MLLSIVYFSIWLFDSQTRAYPIGSYHLSPYLLITHSDSAGSSDFMLLSALEAVTVSYLAHKALEVTKFYPIYYGPRPTRSVSSDEQKIEVLYQVE